MRITGQLIDALTGTHLWAERFYGSLEDVFELQDKVATHVAGLIEPALQAAEIRRSIARPTADLSAYDLYLRALASFFPITKDRIVEFFEAVGSGDRTRQALRAGAFLGGHLPHAHRSQQLGRSVADAIRQGRQTCPEGPSCRRERSGRPCKCRVCTFTLQRRYQYHDCAGRPRAVTQPELRARLDLSGQIRLLAGQYDQAIEHVGMSLRLSPRERTGNPQS